jgi:hypothetical protein
MMRRIEARISSIDGSFCFVSAISVPQGLAAAGGEPAAGQPPYGGGMVNRALKTAGAAG